MDHGSLTDHSGKKVDFRNVVLIMTTNAGAADMQKAAIGFGSSVRKGDDVEAINKLFTPEFRNRLMQLSHLVHCLCRLSTKWCRNLCFNWKRNWQNVMSTFDLSEEATAWLADKGYDERMGARPLGRVIQENIKKPLAEEILFGKLKKGGIVKVDIEADDKGKKKIALESLPDTPAEAPKKAAKPRKKSATKVEAKVGAKHQDVA